MLFLYKYDVYKRQVFATKVKYSISSGTKVYFEKPDSWGDQIFAYVYNDELYENCLLYTSRQ